jgi:uroporphyrin-III C-methyltransferase
MSKKIAILGLGWLGKPLAESLYDSGSDITGSTTSFDKLKTLATLPFYVGKLTIDSDKINGDWDSFIQAATHLIINIPPKRIADIKEVYPNQIKQIIANTNKNVKVIFVSSTAVYGDEAKVFSESDTPKPSKNSGFAVLEAEQLLENYFGKNLTILRLAGLIGPDRHPGKILKGKTIEKNPYAPVNLIHQTDCIDLINAIIEQDYFGETVNGCASLHPIRKDYYKNAAIALSIPPPVFKDAWVDSKGKTIDNSKSKNRLNFTYTYDNPETIFLEKSKAKVSIIGAGPGNVKLLTVGALELIKSADVILHDNLISKEILNLNKTGERIYVGRKYGDLSNQTERQDTINKLLVVHFKTGSKVVRLKSGDPYIYGRAAEEARYLTKHNVPFTVIPGISAALAAANSCNIPITERQKSNAVLICTAHTADYSFDQLKGIAELLKAGNSLALYMGLKSLDKLIPKLIEVCGDRTIPINAVSNVSRENEVLLTSTLENIRKDIDLNPLEMPVVFLIGVKPIQNV